MAFEQPVTGGSNVLHAPSSAFSKESVKWEAQWTPHGPPQRPYVKHEYPMMVHRAGEPPGGMGALTVVESITVESAQAATMLRGQGFRPTPIEAIEAYEARQTENATGHAGINYDIKNTLSPRAGAEAQRALDASPDHLGEVKETPILRRIPKKSHHKATSSTSSPSGAA